MVSTAQPNLESVPVSAILLTFNEEANVKDCLDSVAGWCGEIFIVDSGSTDRTLEICRRYTDRIYFHEFVDSASQWEWALRNLPLSYDWVLPLDADHVLTDRLRQQLMDKLRAPDPSVDGYFARHQYFFNGTPVRGFKPYSLRLFRRDKTRLDHSELVDFRFVVQGKTAFLSGWVYERNQNESAIDFWIDKHQRFSTRVAIEEVLRTSGRLTWSMRPRLLGNPDERIVWLKNRWYHLPLYVRPFLYFFYRYILRLGCLDGWNGFVYHFLHAFWFRLLVDLKIGDLRRRIERGETSIDALGASVVHRF